MNYISVGKFGKTHGLKGWIRVYSGTNSLPDLIHYHPWYQKTKSSYEVINIDTVKQQGDHLLVHVQSIDTPEDAKLLTNQKIYVSHDQLPKLENSYYFSELMGMRVINTAGIELGVVDEIMETGANDVLILKGNKRRLIPFVKERVIKKVDLNKKEIIADWASEDG